jgi:hypothetical protein
VWVLAVKCSYIAALRKRVGSRYRILMHYRCRKRVDSRYRMLMHHRRRKRVDSRSRMLMHYRCRMRVGFHYPSRMHAQVPSDIRISSSYWTQRTLYAAFSNIWGAIGLHCSYWLEKRPILVFFQWIASLESENMLQELKICK